jgi:hypothetical protein
VFFVGGFIVFDVPWGCTNSIFAADGVCTVVTGARTSDKLIGSVTQ